jgi:hypothetical protein
LSPTAGDLIANAERESRSVDASRSTTWGKKRWSIRAKREWGQAGPAGGGIVEALARHH